MAEKKYDSWFRLGVALFVATVFATGAALVILGVMLILNSHWFLFLGELWLAVLVYAFMNVET